MRREHWGRWGSGAAKGGWDRPPAGFNGYFAEREH